MVTLSTPPAVVPAASTPLLYHHRSRLSWAAIIGGLCAAMAMQVIFMMLGAGLGFAIYHPITSSLSISVSISDKCRQRRSPSWVAS